MLVVVIHGSPTDLARPLRLVEVSGGLERDWGTVPAGRLEDGVGEHAVQTPRLVVRSGRDADAGGDAESAFAAWSGASWGAFDAAAAGLVRSVESAGVAPVIWTGTGSVLSDAVSTLTFARRQPGVRLLVDPVAWVTASMAKDAEDHLARFAQALGLCGSLDAVVVRPMPLGAGLDVGRVAGILRPLLELVGTAVGTGPDLREAGLLGPA